jgi:hypothetical protein
VRFAWLVALLLAALAPRSAGAQSDAAKQEAAVALERGVAFYQEGDYDAALAEFLRSRERYPARGNTLNAALCLGKLQRYDEALVMFETLLREVPDLRAGEKQLVEKEVTALRTRVGAVDVRILEPGATVLIGGRERGTTPLSSPVRVAAGSHVVRVLKEGFSPFEVLVTVAGEQQVVVDGRLRPLAQAGRLKVTAASGEPAEVLLDGAPVGPTPWEGTVAVGRHIVQLKGAGDLGTAPASAQVRAGSVSALALELTPLRCTLRVSPSPAGAAVAIDGVEVGNGVWLGPLGCGPHTVELAAPGFLTERRRVDLVAGPRGELELELERDPDSAEWQREHPDRVVIRASGGPALSPSMGGTAATDCTESCDSGVPFGAITTVTGGYQFGSGIGVGIHAGYLQLAQTTASRAVEVRQVPNGSPLPATVDDERLLRAGMIGASAWFRRGDPWSLAAQLGVGATLGNLETRRQARLGGAPIDFPQQSAARHAMHVQLELEAGYAVLEHVQIALVLRGVALFAIGEPSWQQQHDAFTPAAGFVDFPAEELTSAATLVFSPGLALTLSI